MNNEEKMYKKIKNHPSVKQIYSTKLLSEDIVTEEFIEKNDCQILDSFVLDEQIWWNDYYKCLEKELSAISDTEFLKLFKLELLEIELYKKDSSQYKSTYYVIRKN